jgi:dihydroorotase
MLTRREFSRRIFAAGGLSLAAAGSLSAQEPSVAERIEQGRIQNQGGGIVLIKGGTVVDPSQHLHAPLDVAIENGKILEVSPDFPEKRALQVISAKGKIITPGFIDLHVHCFDGVTLGMNADHYCLDKGVTTAVDAGSMGYLGVGRFVQDIVNTSKTRVYTLVHIGALGPTTELRHPMEELSWVDPRLTARAAEANKPAVVGIKVHLSKAMSSRSKDLEPEFLKRALEAAEASHLPLMAHVNDSYYPLQDSLTKLRKGDVFTHCFNSYPQDSLLDPNGKLWPEVLEARERGVIFDVGEGHYNHFSFDVADKCLQQGFLPDTISTDLNRNSVAELDLPNTVSKFLALGMSLDNAIACVTTNPARVFDYGVQIGTLRPGAEANISISELREGTFEFSNFSGGKRQGRQKLVNKAVICRGQLLINEV